MKIVHIDPVPVHVESYNPDHTRYLGFKDGQCTFCHCSVWMHRFDVALWPWCPRCPSRMQERWPGDTRYDLIGITLPSPCHVGDPILPNVESEVKLVLNSLEEEVTLGPLESRLVLHVPGVRTNKARELMYRRQGGLCHLCLRHMPKGDATAEHVLPRSKGGDYTYENIRLTHSSCNGARGTKAFYDTVRFMSLTAGAVVLPLVAAPR